MSISPISGIRGITATDGVGAISRSTETKPGDSSFSKLVGNLISDANSQHGQADQSLKSLMTGESDNLHEVVLDAAKADISFRLLMEIRNRLLDSYQEIMRMQV